MIQKDFDIAAMDRKIKANLEKGFTLKEIYAALCYEMRTNLQSISAKHSRNVELSDQIEYIEEKIFNLKEA